MIFDISQFDGFHDAKIPNLKDFATQKFPISRGQDLFPNRWKKRWRMTLTLTFHHSKCAAPWDTHACQYQVAIFNIAKVMTKVKVLDRMTDRMTDRPKTIYPLFLEEGGITSKFVELISPATYILFMDGCKLDRRTMPMSPILYVSFGRG